MIGKPHRLFGRLGAVAVRRGRPLDQYDGQAENAGGNHLAIGRFAAGILADDHVDPVFVQKRDFRFHGEGAAGQQIVDMRRRHRRVDRVDAAHEIVVLRRGVESPGFLSTDSEEDASRCLAQRGHGLGHGRNARPAVALCLVPAKTFQPQQRNANFSACSPGIGGNLPGKGVGRVDHEIDGPFTEIGRKPRNAAETAGAHRHGLRCGIDRAAGQRQRNGKIQPAGKPACQIARIGGAAQYEDASLVHA